MHLHDSTVGFMGTSAIVGSSISLAVGDSFAARLANLDRITVAFGGDSVVETGQWWEALSFASLHKLQILFVIEDNGLSTATPKHKRQPEFKFPLPVEDTRDDALRAWFGVEAIRLKLPAILRVRTRRFYEHVGMERLPGYEQYPKDDPLVTGRVAALVPLTRQSAEQVDEIEWDVRARVKAAFEKAEVAEWPHVSSS